MVVIRGKSGGGAGKEGKGCQICGDGRGLEFGWWAHKGVYRCTSEIYVINWCYSNKLIIKNTKFSRKAGHLSQRKQRPKSVRDHGGVWDMWISGLSGWKGRIHVEEGGAEPREETVGPVEETCIMYVFIQRCLWMVLTLWKTISQFVIKLNLHMQFDSFLSIYLQRNENVCSYKSLYVNVYSSCICNWPKL